jgi:hypothetical protein
MPIQRNIDNSQPETATKKSSAVLIIALGIVFLIAAGGFVWSYVNYSKIKKEFKTLTDPKAQEDIAKQEVQDVVEQVKKLAVLPENETPTVATITDADSLSKEQPFYKGAHNGDKLIVYMQAKKAIIYDSVRNIIVNIGPIFVDDSQQAPATLSVEVRNGSNKSGMGTTVAEEIKKMTGFSVIKVANAENNSYTGNVLVDRTNGAKKAMIESLRVKYNATVVTAVPEGESISEAEALLIIGN